MREAAEALDDRAMAMRVVEHVGVLGRCRGEPGEQAHRLVLHRQALGVLERQVDEGAHERRQRFVLARADHPARRGERARIAGERARRAAKRIARELVEQEDLRERRSAASRPTPSSSPRRARSIERAEALADRGVERVVLREPRLRCVPMVGAVRRAEPEVEHRLRLAGRRLAHRALRRKPARVRSRPSARRRRPRRSPSCRLTCSCMLRCGERRRAPGSARTGTSQASTLPARRDPRGERRPTTPARRG